LPTNATAKPVAQFLHQYQDCQAWAELASLRFLADADSVLIMGRWGWEKRLWPTL
jgi:hypothetical protein